jgi:hypothetical protein
LRISEAYEHEPILPYSESCSASGCTQTGTQCVDVSVPMQLTPVAEVGTVTVACQGATPTVVCTTDEEGTSCTVTMTQRLCVSVPIRYSVDVEAGTAAIGCASETACGCGQ